MRLILCQNLIRGYDAKTGKFIPLAEAEHRKVTAIVETVKKK